MPRHSTEASKEPTVTTEKTEEAPEAVVNGTAQVPNAAPVATAVVTPFDLDGLLTKIEQAAPKAVNVKRQLVASLAGLLDDKKYKALRRDLVKKQGVAETDMEAFEAFSTSPVAEAAWVAFCDHAYNGLTVVEATVKHKAEASIVQLMVDTNVLGLFAKWASWPPKKFGI